ncbi:hypothetical protein THARTR1_01649 [Trichoderma harzianum]|uniref:Uncharacterized protein n=1 Tax=Trichoderma harzianum TaxID=5544 RepID=A0A2K0ULG7_TRIHA|nr:hypothetical protein THARTR1_01649 [Trichoderma harzianum]
MDGRVKEEPDQALGTATAPIPVDDIPLELFRIYPMPCDDDNVVNKAIYHQLIKQYIAEKNDWPPELQDDFKSEDKRLEYRISRTTGIASFHRLSRWMLSGETTWARFWTLRVMFGPRACANQGWFEEFARDYPMALNDAPAGIIPDNFENLFDLQQWTPEEPQIERWAFHPTKRTRHGRRKPVKILNVNRKRPKCVNSSASSSNIDAITRISTTAVSEVKIARPARDERRNTALQDSHGNRSGSPARNSQPNQQFNDNISRLEEIVRQCSALQKAQAEALVLLCSQIQLLKEERNANDERLED